MIEKLLVSDGNPAYLAKYVNSTSEGNLMRALSSISYNVQKLNNDILSKFLSNNELTFVIDPPVDTTNLLNCPLCSFTTKYKNHLATHYLKIHTGDVPQCSVDPLCTNPRKRVKTERPFKCDLCSKAFVKKQSLTLHERTHSPNELPFVCTMCTFETYRRKIFKKHLSSH